MTEESFAAWYARMMATHPEQESFQVPAHFLVEAEPEELEPIVITKEDAEFHSKFDAWLAEVTSG